MHKTIQCPCGVKVPNAAIKHPVKKQENKKSKGGGVGPNKIWKRGVNNIGGLYEVGALETLCQPW